MAKLKDHKTFLEDLSKLQPELFSNLEFLSEYTNRREPILTKCKICGYEATKYPQNLLKGMRCQKCYKVDGDFSQRRTHEEFSKELADKQPALFSNITFVTEYVKANKTFDVKCNMCGRIRKKNSFDLLAGEQCVCTKPSKTHKGILTPQEVEGRLSQLLPNYIFSEVDYTQNMKQKVTVACDKGHLSSISLADIFTGTICKVCAYDNKRRPDLLIDHLNKHPHVKWIEGDYHNCKSKLTFKCEYHGEFKGRPDQLLGRDVACPTCSRINQRPHSLKQASRNKEEYLTKPSVIYLLHIEDIGFKVGIASNLKTRLNTIKNQSGKDVSVIKSFDTNLYNAILIESDVLNSFKRKYLDRLFDGYTEVLDAELEDILAFMELKVNDR